MKIEITEYRRKDGVVFSRGIHHKKWSIRNGLYTGIFWNKRLRRWQSNYIDFKKNGEDIFMTEEEGLEILKTIPKVK